MGRHTLSNISSNTLTLIIFLIIFRCDVSGAADSDVAKSTGLKPDIKAAVTIFPVLPGLSDNGATI